MDECIDSLEDAKIFTTLACNSGYWQIPVRPEDREKTTFTSHEGLYWFLRMPFGFRNAPATFQRYVDITLSGLTWKTCLEYLDDIIVISKTPTEHMAHLDAVIHHLYRAGITLNLCGIWISPCAALAQRGGRETVSTRRCSLYSLAR
jgi:hypothetical protein